MVQTVQCMFCWYRHICCCVLTNVTTYPPPNPYISEAAFSCRFQKVHTYPPPPQRNDILAHRTENSENLRKVPKPTELAHYDQPPRDMHWTCTELVAKASGNIDKETNPHPPTPCQVSPHRTPGSRTPWTEHHELQVGGNTATCLHPTAAALKHGHEHGSMPSHCTVLYSPVQCRLPIRSKKKRWRTLRYRFCPLRLSTPNSTQCARKTGGTCASVCVISFLFFERIGSLHCTGLYSTVQCDGMKGGGPAPCVCAPSVDLSQGPEQSPVAPFAASDDAGLLSGPLSRLSSACVRKVCEGAGPWGAFQVGLRPQHPQREGVGGSGRGGGSKIISFLSAFEFASTL